jgi:16S rRNA (cytidine1402-2'-O)-methyltransferase
MWANIATMTTGTLLLAGTPLGNPSDASPRLTAALLQADLVAAEDTRRLARLMSTLGVRRDGPVVSYYEAVEEQRWPRIAEVLASGGTVVLVTDAGMPAVSDPGYRAVRAALAAGHAVDVIPGPSAVTAALAVSGLPSDRFCFEGFLPRRGRATRLAQLRTEVRTQVYFESPRRLADTLAALCEHFGADRAAVVCRELTKSYQEVRRGSLGELSAWAGATEVRGEITLVVAGATGTPEPADPDELAASVRSHQDAGMTRKEAIAAVARLVGRPKREVYAAVIAADQVDS